MTKKQKQQLINRCVSVLTENNGINIMLMGKLSDKLEAMDEGQLADIIASQYSPEGNIRWQTLLDMAA